MADTCYCDYERPDCYWSSRPLARKEHRCEECGRRIQPGERYERVRMITRGDGPWTCKTCLYCLAMRDLVESRAECFCWAHGNLVEDIRGTVDNLRYEIPGLAMAVGRIAVESKRDRANRFA